MKILISISFVFLSLPLFAQSIEKEEIKQVNGIELYYRSIGSGEPMLVLHGGPGMDGSYLHPFINPLGKNFQIITFDQRASGKSTGISEPQKLTADQFVEDIEGFRKALGLEKFHLMGHSWGGQLAMRYAIKYPEQLSSLILVSSGGAEASVSVTASERVMERLSPEDQEAYFKMVSEGYWDSKEGLDEMAKIFWKPYVADQANLTMIKDAYSDHSTTVQRSIDQSTEGFNLYDQLSRLTVPTLVIHGDYDPIPIDAIEQIHQAIENSKLVILKDCGHFPFIEKQAEFIKTINDYFKK